MVEYYVLEKFAEHDKTLASILETIPIKRKAIDIYRGKNNLQRAKDMYTDLVEQAKKLLETIMSLQLLFAECSMTESADYAARLYASVKQFNLMTEDYSKFLTAVEKLKSAIPSSEKVNSKIIVHGMNDVKMGYYPTDISHVQMIQQALTFPAESVNLLDPCCGCGLALATLAQGADSLTYGMELDESRAQEAETRLTRVGFGSFFHSSMSWESVHCLFLNPPYLNVLNESGFKARHEKRFLVESLHHLMQDGVLIYIIPYYRLTQDICRVLCDNFKDISVYRFLDKEFAKFKQIAVLGVRKPKGNGSRQAEILSQYAMHPEKIPMLDTLQKERYPLPEFPKKVELFKGARFNLGELKRQLAESKSLDVLFEKSRIDAMEKRPLLPLNIGQVGLIGGSGLINGYVDCEEPHVIKGRVIKEVKRYRDTEQGTLTETRVNRMLFNILTPEGVKRLA